MNPLIQNIAKAKGFNQDQQLVLQIALGGLMGGNNRGASYGSKSDPWMGMIMTLAGLLLAQKAMQKANLAQTLNPQSGPPTIGQSAMSLAKMLITSPTTSSTTSNPLSNISQINPNLKPLQQAQASLTNPTSQNLQNSANTLPTFKTTPIQPMFPSNQLAPSIP